MEFKRFLVVYDPTREEQPALERAAIIAAEVGATLHLFACIHGDADKKSEEAKSSRAEQKALLNERLAPIAATGVKTSSEVKWKKDWYHAVVRASARNNADMVFKSSFKHSASQRRLKTTSDWTLIRECQCPVLLVKTTDRPAVPRILAGIDIRATAASYEKLNQHIIEFSRLLVESEMAEVHVLNAFQDYRVRPERQELIDVSGVDTEHVHIKMGTPEVVIVEMAKKLDASLVIVGNSHRSGLAAMLHGNTAEKILDKLDCNVLAMP